MSQTETTTPTGGQFDHILMEVHLYHPTVFGSGVIQRCCYGSDDLTHLFAIFREHGLVLTAKELVGQPQPPPGRVDTPARPATEWSPSLSDYTGHVPGTCCVEVALVHRRLLHKLEALPAPRRARRRNMPPSVEEELSESHLMEMPVHSVRRNLTRHARGQSSRRQQSGSFMSRWFG